MMDNIKTDDQNTKKEILWLSVDKYTSSTPHPCMMTINRVRITSPADELRRCARRISDGMYGYIVMVLSEGVIISMIDDEYHAAIHAIIESIITSRTPHTIMIQNYLYDDQKFHIFDEDYDVNYIRRSYYRVHKQFAFDLIQRYYPSGKNDPFLSYLSEYLEQILTRAHDLGNYEMLNEMLESKLYQSLLSQPAREFIAKTAGSTVFLNKEEADSYKYYLSSVQNIQFIPEEAMNIPLDPVFSEGESLSPFDTAASSSGIEPGPEEDEGEDLFPPFDVTEIAKQEDWKKIHTYTKRSCKERSSNNSKKQMANLLSNKTFRAFIASINKLPSAKEKEQMVQQATELISELRSLKDANVMTFSNDSELGSYLQDVIGETHTVFRHYILQDNIWSDELDRYLAMFQDYMARMQHIDVSIDREYTADGILYIIKSRSTNLTESSFHDFSDAFSELLGHIEQDQEQTAKEIVDKYNITEEGAQKIVQDYRRKCEQLRRDMKYNYQRKMLDLQEDLERGLIDQIEQNAMQAKMKESEKKITSLIDRYSSIIDIENASLVERETPIADAITGDYSFTDDEDELIALFYQYDPNPVSLVSDLKITRDTSAPHEKKITSGMRIRQFLGRHREDIGEERAQELKEAVFGKPVDYTEILPFFGE